MSIKLFEPLSHIRYQLAEGILKLEDQEIILWTDIKQKKICEYNFENQIYSEYQFPHLNPSALFETESPNIFMVAANTSIYLWNKQTNEIIDSVIHPDLNSTQTRFNDGKIDPHGKYLLLGTMDLYDRPNKAALYQVIIPETPEDPTKPLKDTTFVEFDFETPISLSNGLAWSQTKELSKKKNNQYFYYVDTPTREIKVYNETPIREAYEYTYDLTKHAVGRKGVPDGITISSENHLFVAMYGAGCIVEFAPTTIQIFHHNANTTTSTKTLEIKNIWRLPNATYPTNMTFIDKRTIIVTTSNPENKTETNDGKIFTISW